MTNPNTPLPSRDERIVPKPKASSSNNKTVIIVISLFFTFFLIIFIVGFLWFIIFYSPRLDRGMKLYQVCLSAPNSPGCNDCLGHGEEGEMCNKCESLYMSVTNEKPFSGSEEEYLKKYCSQSTVSTDLYQTCLSAPNTKGCEDCKNYGSNGDICNECEQLYGDYSKGLSFDSQDQQYFGENCSFNEVYPSTGEGELKLFGTDWASFRYLLSDQGIVSGIAPTSHSFGTDSHTSSSLRNSINFSFNTYDNLLGSTSVNASITLSEGIYSYYDIEPILVDAEKTLYKFEDLDADSIYYTDSYEKEKCAEYVEPLISQPSSSGICGTGMLFNHSFYASCEFEGDETTGVGMCDEFFKNLNVQN